MAANEVPDSRSAYVEWEGVRPTGVYDMLHTERAMPEIPAPVHDYLESTVLFCGSETMKQSSLPPGPTGAVGRVSNGGGGGHSSNSNNNNAISSTTGNASSSSSPIAPLPKRVPKEDLPINLEALQLHLLVEGTLAPEDAISIVEAAQSYLEQENNVLELEEPITVVGDIHGQFYDLIKLLEIGGDPAEQSYLFLGDYVDRGCFSCECVLYLLSLKVCFPRRIYLLRGNHEGRHLTSYFSFKAECYYKYSPEFYNACMVCFDHLPLAATVGDRYFCVHGGLSPEVMHIEEINYIQRTREIPTGGAMCDLLWSDPHWDVVNPVAPAAPYGGGAGGGAGNSGNNNNNNRGGAPPTFDFATSSFYETEPLFTPNQSRGCSFIFNFASLLQFLQTNHRLTVIRAHEAQEEGYQLYRPLPNTHFPSMISLFSAPNYCDSYNNKGAILTLKSGEMSIKQYYSSPHPYVLPNFMNGIEWSLPFVADKVGDLLRFIEDLLEDEEEYDDADEGGVQGGEEGGSFPAATAGPRKATTTTSRSGIGGLPLREKLQLIANISRVLNSSSIGKNSSGSNTGKQTSSSATVAAPSATTSGNRTD